MNTSTGQRPPGTTAPAVRRDKSVKRSVIIADRVADRVITVGGILVIVAVLGILVFLVQETVPLFRGGHVTAAGEYRFNEPMEDILGLGMDDHKAMAFVLTKDGTFRLFHARTGRGLKSPVIDLGSQPVSAYAHSIGHRHLAFGYPDGTVRFAATRFVSQIIPPQDLPVDLQPIDERDSTDGEAVYSRIPGDQFRKTRFEIDVDESVVASADGLPIISLDYRVSGEAERQTRAFVAVDEGLGITLNLVQSRINLLTGKRRSVVKKTRLPDLPEPVALHSVLLSDNADRVLVTARDGRAYRYDTREFGNPTLAEITPLLGPGIQLESLGYLFGGQSLMVGGSDGSLTNFFLINRPKRGTRDGRALVKARSYETGLGPVVRFTAGSRGKSFAVGDGAGRMKVIHGTSQKTLAAFAVDASTPAGGIVLSPRDDGLMTVSADGTVHLWEFSVPHPETTFRTLFQKVWYEGYDEPTYTWQSSAGTDDYEQKLSLTPLIFGSIKAAVYSLLFAVPISILGAIYTSEFLNNRVRSVVKPAMEMMASLPSVVLGFVAALVLAPIVETWIAAVLLAVIAIPSGLIIGSFLWQLLPVHLASRWQGIPKFATMAIVIVLATVLTYHLGVGFEHLMFEGDFKAWLNRDVGTAEPFLFLVLLPVSLMGVAAVISRYFGNAIAQFVNTLTPFKAALCDIGKWMAMILVSATAAWGGAKLMALMGLDARGGLVDTYVQRNTLVVGFAMGFAVIPIIYTIAEDALNAVPDHLRAASLGCGATPWQTALYVVLPTALSGVFSAIMIGMGRAVGETMIVVMAAGNTPLMDWNVFNGLRALSATIAVELPEAVKDGTLYRVLFLSGLVLFAMTFVINTVAEIVRLRFRKRATQL